MIEEPVDYTVMDQKLEPVMKLLHAHQPQLALDRLRFLQQQGTFLKGEMWRVYQRMAECYFELLDMDKAQQAYWEALNHTAGLPYRKQCELYSNYLFILHYVPHLTDTVMIDQHKGYGQLAEAVTPFVHQPRDPARRHQKIRVGYIAPVFIKNVVSFFSIQLMMRYDRSRYEVYLYSLWPHEDIVTEDLKKQVTGWASFTPATPFEEIAQRIYDDEIDILFDLTVHAEGGRTLQVMSRRPAPVQVAGIGYMSTSGTAAIDYFLTDIHLDPPGQHDDQFAEKLLRLPYSHFCYTPPERFLQCKKTYHLHQPVVFGSFNNFAKITDDMLLLWKEILRRVPDARMLLKHSNVRTWVIRRVTDRARRLGLPMDRITVEGSSADYLDRYMDIDILLDTYPYVGGGTTCDALLRGTPVITRYGERHGTRFGYSLLANLGLTELAADSDEAYVEKAVQLARSPERLAALHETIAQRMMASPIMDAVGYVHDVEDAYASIWRTWQLTPLRNEQENTK